MPYWKIFIKINSLKTENPKFLYQAVIVFWGVELYYWRLTNVYHPIIDSTTQAVQRKARKRKKSQ